jgi:transcriptional regulator with GAF, ATPase, and Fis domain/tetratricopeptide (TPR) repeat protein
MAGENLEQNHVSRYITKKVLGDYPPWRGYSVTDSLSEKKYLRFALLPGEQLTLSLVDLRMREALFSGEIFPRTLSLEKSNGEISFLLPFTELIPLTKALPSMEPQKSALMMKKLFAEILARMREGLIFGNLIHESFVLAGKELWILPTAYLLPTEIHAMLTGEGNGLENEEALLLKDIRDIGALLGICARYVPPDKSEAVRKLSLRFAEAPSGCDLYDLTDELISLFSMDKLKAFTSPLMEPPYIAPSGALENMEEAARRATADERQLVMVSGRNGEGKSRFLRESAKKLTGELGYERGLFLSDQNLFQDAELGTFPNAFEFVIVDDHSQEPLISCHMIDRLCHDLRHCKLAIIVVNEKSPGYFIDSLREECRRKGIGITRIALRPLDPAEKKRAASSLLPKRSSQAIPRGKRSLASMILNVRGRLAVDHPKKSPSLLGSLTEEERSILNFMAVFCFEVPLSFLQTVYSISGHDMYSTIKKFRTLGLITARAEVSNLAGGELCLLYKISSRSLAMDMLAAIPRERKQQIHRNIAYMLKEIAQAPALYIFHHLARGGELAEAAEQGYRLFQSLLSRKNLSAINCFNESYLSEKLDEHLPCETCFNLLLELGNYFSFIGNIDRAEAFYRRCREEIDDMDEVSKYRTIAVEAVRKECEILEKRGEFLKAEKLLDKTLDAHGEHLLSNERAKLFNDLAWVHYRLGQFGRSHENCLLVHKLLDEKHYPLEIAQTYNLMGTINWNRSEYEDALNCHKKCLALRERCNEEIGIATSYNNLGLVYRSMGRLIEALDCFKKSMEIKQRLNSLPGLAAANLNIALVYLDMGKLEESESSCLTATRLAEDIGNQQLLAEAYGTLGEIKFLLGYIDEARDYYYKDLHICQKTRSQREKAVVFRRLAELSLAEGKHDEAVGLLKQAKSLNRAIGSRLETCLINIIEARMHLARGKREQGKRLLEGTSLELSLLGRKNIASTIASEIGKLYFDEGNEALAREYLIRAVSMLGDSVKTPLEIQVLLDTIESQSNVSFEQIRSDSDRFKALCRLISIIRTIHDPDKLYDMIVETAMKITGMERAALIIQGDGKETFSILAEGGSGAMRRIISDKNVRTILAVTRQLAYPLDISRVNLPSGKVGDAFLKKHPSIICIPLLIEDEVTGFLYLDSAKESAGTSEEDHSFLVAFSQQVALGLEKIILSERIRSIEIPKPIKPTAHRTKERVAFRDIVGNSPAIRHIFELINGIKDMDTTVLLIGENGTGKDLFAKTIHYNSHRRDKPLVSLNCSTIPRELIESELFGHEKGAFTGAHRQRIGHFESANGGTIFLNEVRDLPLDLQPTLLRVLEEQRFYRIGGRKEISTDVRIIAATNIDLLELIKKKRFREDLYFRLNVFPIRIPSLRERKEDIEPLCNHFLATYCRMYNISVKKIAPEAFAYLFDYGWPGNVRELENVVNRLVIMSKKDMIMVEDLPEDIIRRPRAETSPMHPSLEEAFELLLDSVESSKTETAMSLIELEVIRRSVRRAGSVREAARRLGISKPTIYNKLKKYEENNR